MFDNLKAMGAIAGLLKNQDKLRVTADKIKSKLASARIEAQAGGGAVRATVDGQLTVIAVELSPALASSLGTPEARATAGAMIAEAVNAASEQARQRLAEEMAREADAMGLPPEMLQGLRGLMP
jgi:hypothetical protein